MGFRYASGKVQGKVREGPVKVLVRIRQGSDKVQARSSGRFR